ncbi:hypothetical protein QVD17_06424 [Tagetes erecta]|uniref:Uncharacterized protein n=1 Tax=Tagetes erecta TaxID=13708 RepID=A0AAD8P6F9_TARER|nr:hypothetical protein QVD17_06424 [Tagetes erecta]
MDCHKPTCIFGCFNGGIMFFFPILDQGTLIKQFFLWLHGSLGTIEIHTFPPTPRLDNKLLNNPQIISSSSPLKKIPFIPFSISTKPAQIKVCFTH